MDQSKINELRSIAIQMEAAMEHDWDVYLQSHTVNDRLSNDERWKKCSTLYAGYVNLRLAIENFEARERERFSKPTHHETSNAEAVPVHDDVERDARDRWRNSSPIHAIYSKLDEVIDKFEELRASTESKYHQETTVKPAVSPAAESAPIAAPAEPEKVDEAIAPTYQEVEQHRPEPASHLADEYKNTTSYGRYSSQRWSDRDLSKAPAGQDSTLKNPSVIRTRQ